MTFPDCHLLQIKDLSYKDLDFEQIKVLAEPDGGPGADHYNRYLVKCKKCGELFLKEYIEWWGKDGEDKIIENYFPVTEASYSYLNKFGWNEIRSYKPYITFSDKPVWVT